MSIRDLRTFLFIVDSGSFVAAAKAIYRTQSAVTAQIQTLEEQLGLQLFDRTSRPPKLTQAGKALIPRAREVVSAYDSLFHGTERVDLRGHLHLGVVPSAMTGLMPRGLLLLAERHPGLHVELEMGLSAELVPKVEHGLLDSALISDPLETDLSLEWSPVVREPLVLIVPIDAPQASAVELLRAYPFMRYTSHAWVGRLIERVLHQKRLRVHETMVLNTLEAIISMVHAGLGVSIVPMRSIEPMGAPPVRMVPLPGSVAFRTLGLIEAADHPKITLSHTLLNALRDVVAPLSDGIKDHRIEPPHERKTTAKKSQ